MTRYIRTVFILSLFLLLPSLAIAADDAPILQPLLVNLLAVVASAATAYLAAVLRKLARKVDDEGKVIKGEWIDLVARRAVSAVEERAADLIRREGPDILKGEQKLEAAAADILDRVPGIDKPEARRLARAALVWLGQGASARLEEEAAERALERNP